ncbi:MAG TPA: Vi polysaccharide biosynthesis UDP-N-acetylglucosamine C-6 dehydrogenase TviB, partial [Pseudomonadales bacterium]
MRELSDVCVAVIGLGYVGLPLAVELGRKYRTLGFDIDAQRIGELRDGIDRTLEVTAEDLRSSARLEFTSTADDLRTANTYI